MIRGSAARIRAGDTCLTVGTASPGAAWLCMQGCHHVGVFVDATMLPSHGLLPGQWYVLECTSSLWPQEAKACYGVPAVERVPFLGVQMRALSEVLYHYAHNDVQVYVDSQPVEYPDRAALAALFVPFFADIVWRPVDSSPFTARSLRSALFTPLRTMSHTGPPLRGQDLVARWHAIAGGRPSPASSFGLYIPVPREPRVITVGAAALFAGQGTPRPMHRTASLRFSVWRRKRVNSERALRQQQVTPRSSPRARAP